MQSPLHQFDLSLCEYVCGNVNIHLEGTDTEAQDMVDWLTRGITCKPVLDYVRSARNAELLLSTDELVSLVLSQECIPFELYREWVPWTGLHRLYTACLREIREGLAGPPADEFAQTSVRIARELEREPLGLHKGLLLVQEWVETVRQLKRDLRMRWALPWSGGEFPTPTHRKPTTVQTKAAVPSRRIPPPTHPNPTALGQLTLPEAAGTSLQGPLTALSAKLDTLLSQRPQKEWYTTEDAATYLRRSEYTVREWCRHRQCHAEKRKAYRGGKKQWMIPHAELLRLESDGPKVTAS